ncbi:MAG: alpha-glucan family phosphorylase [Candidatus Hodarchaeales archaeon]
MEKIARLPERINRLPELAYNLFWAWHTEARELFKRLDHPLWISTNHNPVKMLQTIRPERVLEMSRDPSFLKKYDYGMYSMDKELSATNLWFQEQYPDYNGIIAYVSAEFGLHQSLPIYSGGLGILAGDHIKEASDLGIPLVGVGFIYPQGYFKQKIQQSGWQDSEPEDFKFSETPVKPVIKDGSQLNIPIEVADKTVWVRVWQLTAGRNKMYLMDTDSDKNAPWDRELSSRLYGGDKEIRLRQEIVLGFGPVKLLKALGLKPGVFHLNEGHSAFVALELLAEEMRNGCNFEEAREKVKSKIVFTTHTPVAAGHDRFPFEVIDKYFSKFYTELGIPREEFLKLGEWEGMYNMTALALRFSYFQNGVSKINARLGKEMWNGKWDIQPITNGVHFPTWLAGPLRQLFKKRIDSEYLNKHDEPGIWELIDDISDEELWGVRQQLRTRMFDFIRDLARRKWMYEKKDYSQILASGALLDPDVLTIGFSRRFATYKRATLIFRDIERLKKIILNPYKPVQIIFSGKAHPADDPGKHLLKKVYSHAIDPKFGGRIVFIENYNMQIARYLTQGVDVWLNTPVPPMEASGTSGMKAAMNGVVNLSIADGWWPEAYNGSNGWVIGGKIFDDREKQDDYDSNSFYSILENEIRPLFYSRNGNDIPEGWLEIIRNSIKTVTAQFSARRMVKEYVTRAYMKNYHK